MPAPSPITVRAEHSHGHGWATLTAIADHPRDFTALQVTLTELAEDLLDSNDRRHSNGTAHGATKTSRHAVQTRIRATIAGPGASERCLTLSGSRMPDGRPMLRVTVRDAEGDRSTRDWPEGDHAAIAYSAHWLAAWAAWNHLPASADDQTRRDGPHNGTDHGTDHMVSHTTKSVGNRPPGPWPTNSRPANPGPTTSGSGAAPATAVSTAAR